MSTRKTYDEDFKRTLVDFFHNGKIQASLIKEYGVSQNALTRWIKQYSTVETDEGVILTAKQVKDPQKRMAQLEEENQILKKNPDRSLGFSFLFRIILITYAFHLLKV